MLEKCFNVSKITLIGCGNVGKSLANAIFLQDSKIYTSQTRKLHLVGLDSKASYGLALKLNNSRPGLSKKYIQVTSAKELSQSCIDYSSIQESDIIVVTAGFPRTPGMKREDLLGMNAKIIKEIGENIKKYAPHSLVIVVTNPLDQMTFFMSYILGASQIVLGLTCIDENRFINAVYEYVSNSREKLIDISHIKGHVIGSHSDSMLIDWDTLKYGKVSLQLDDKAKEKIADITVNSGKNINELCGQSDDVGTANSIFGMLLRFLNGKKVTACVNLVQLNNDFKDCCLGFSVSLEENGKIHLNAQYFHRMSSDFRKKFFDSVEFTQKENRKLLDLL